MREIIKVAFVGTSCTSKTTLLEEYRSRKILGLVLVEEAARVSLTRNPNIQNKFTTAVQGEIQDLIMEMEQAQHFSTVNKIVCDRSVLDPITYVRSQGDLAGSWKLLDRVRFWIPTYQHLLLLNPADVPYENDSIRQEDSQTRQIFHQAFLELFNELGIPCELLSGTLEERTKRVDQLLKL